MAVACLSPLKPSDQPPLDLDALEAYARTPAAYLSGQPETTLALIARIRELEAALATATQTERARCLAICRNRQYARSKHSQQLREEGSHDRSIWVHCKSTEAAACAEEIERGYVPPTQETP